MPGNWDNYPQSSEVCWPQNEKIIGVLGLAPLATADFFHRLCSRPVRKDWEHPRVIIDSNPKIPSRGRHLELAEADPVPFMREGIASLAAQGAQVIAIPCNTAHIFYNQYASDAPAILPNIIDVTASVCARYGCRQALVLASRQVVSHKLYDKALSNCATKTLIPDVLGQKLVGEAIESVKQHGYNAVMAEKIIHLAGESGADAVILGCTELSVLFSYHDITNYKFSVIDSNQALADYVLEYAQNIHKTNHTIEVI